MNHVNGQQIPSIILGDMNINILNQNKASIEKELGIQAGANWNVVRTGYATQRSGNELDWALCFKCNNAQAVMIGPLSNSNAGKGFGTVAQGVSDHALIDYEFDL